MQRGTPPNNPHSEGTGRLDWGVLARLHSARCAGSVRGYYGERFGERGIFVPRGLSPIRTPANFQAPFFTMNKAFVKEPDSNAPAHCPRCGSLGTPIHEETLRAQLPSETLDQLAKSAYFCPFPACEVVYFDSFERTVTTDRFPRPVYPKDTDAPMCGCFGLTEEDIEQDLAEGGVTRVRALLARAKTPEAHCQRLAASGQSCVGEVQRYYMKRRAALQGGAG
jgi:hypothetical protein